MMMKVLWSEQMIVNLLPHKLLAAGAGLLLGLAGNVAWAQNYVNATVDGQLAPVCTVGFRSETVVHLR